MAKSESKEKAHPEHVRAKITERAYFISQSEGFPHGKELIHWLQAEEEILKDMLKGIGNAISKARHQGDSNGSAAKAVAPKQAAKSAAPKASAKAAPKKPAPKKTK